MRPKITNITAIAILTLMFLSAFFSMRDDALTFDELAHIPAGYSYLTRQDYRINPEHPPLAKDLAALPLIFQDLKFPAEHPTWTQKEDAPAWWVQFDLGTQFLYYSGNDPSAIILWSRIPMILLLIALGWVVFLWAKKLSGGTGGIMALVLFAFSPTLLAHGRLVTTDVAAAFGAVIATYFWLQFLSRPAWRNVLLAGIAFGIAMSLKFSLILLVPFFALITFLYPLLRGNSEKKLVSLIKYTGLAVLAGIIGIVFIIWPIYWFHTINYPVEQQIRDTAADLAPHPVPFLKDATLWMTEQPLLRPLAQFARGILMASQRTAFGNTVYFLGEISGSGWNYYFPIVYFFKEPLAFHILAAAVFIFFLARAAKTLFSSRAFRSAANWAREQFTYFALLLFIAIYWIAAIAGNLNIGVRHLIPTLPFLYILLAGGLAHIALFLRSFRLKAAFFGFVFILFLWYAFSSLAAFPYYISYFNEAAGGVKNGYKIAVDSNYDWGQDFYRLLEFVEKNNVQKIHLDYFGGENPEYWLGEKYMSLNPKKVSENLSGGLALSEAGGGGEGWIAVSLNQFMGGVAKPVPGFDQESGYYEWLNQYQPVARAGTSILIYHIP